MEVNGRKREGQRSRTSPNLDLTMMMPLFFLWFTFSRHQDGYSLVWVRLIDNYYCTLSRHRSLALDDAQHDIHSNDSSHSSMSPSAPSDHHPNPLYIRVLDSSLPTLLTSRTDACHEGPTPALGHLHCVRSVVLRGRRQESADPGEL